MWQSIISKCFILVSVMSLGFAMNCRAESPDIPVFSLTAADVPKVVLLMFKQPPRFILEVTYSKEKQAELASLTSADLPKKFKVMLDGKTVSERTATEPATGHSLKVEMASLDEAVAMAKALMQTEGKQKVTQP